MKKLVYALAILFTFATPALAESYKIDTQGAHASVNFRVSHLGFSWIVGRFDNFSGTFDYDAENPANSSVEVELDIQSINTNQAERDQHLRSEDFFEADTYPTAKFVSTGIKVTGDKTAVITGDLTIRDVTKTIDIEATHVGGGKDPWGGFRQGFSGTATIVPADFGMPSPMAKTSVQLILEVEGIRE